MRKGGYTVKCWYCASHGPKAGGVTSNLRLLSSAVAKANAHLAKHPGAREITIRQHIAMSVSEATALLEQPAPAAEEQLS